MGRNQQVLIVDPDVDHRAQLKQALGSLEYGVVAEAAYGIEASRLAAELRPEIVLVHVEEPLALAFRTLESVQTASPRSTAVVISRRNDAETACAVGGGEGMDYKRVKHLHSLSIPHAIETINEIVSLAQVVRKLWLVLETEGRDAARQDECLAERP